MSLAQSTPDLPHITRPFYSGVLSQLLPLSISSSKKKRICKKLVTPRIELGTLCEHTSGECETYVIATTPCDLRWKILGLASIYTHTTLHCTCRDVSTTHDNSWKLLKKFSKDHSSVNGGVVGSETMEIDSLSRNYQERSRLVTHPCLTSRSQVLFVLHIRYQTGLFE